MEAAIARASAGEPALVLLTGPAGIGKTRLVAEFAVRARAKGVQVLSGGCVAVGGSALPYEPFVEVFRHLAHAIDEATLRQVLGTASGELAWLVPELGDVLSGIEADGLDGGGRAPSGQHVGNQLPSQGRLFEHVLGALGRAGRLRPVLVTLEDLHWADPSSLDLLAYLARNLTREPVMLLASARSEARPIVFAELERDSRVERLSLDAFDAAEAAEQLAGILGGTPDAELVERIHARAEGNPFFAEELLAALGSTGAEASALPATLHEILDARLAGLSDGALRVVRVAALAGREGDDRLIADVGGLPARETYAALREAIAHQVLQQPADHDGGWYPFRHALLREVAAADLLPGERRDLHAAIAGALAERDTGAPAASLAVELARHWLAANRPRPALVAALRAASAAAAVPAHAVAAAQYEAAAGLWSHVDDAQELVGRDVAAVLESAARESFLGGDSERAVELARRAIAELDAAGQSDRVGFLYSRVASYLSAMSNDLAALEAVREAQRLLSKGGDPVVVARTKATEGAALMLLGRYHESLVALKDALRLAAAQGDSSVEGAARNYSGVDMVYLGDVAGGLEQLRKALELAHASESGEELVEAYHNLACMLDVSGNPAEAAETARDGFVQARRFGLERRSGAGLLAVAGAALYRLGRWTEAEMAFREALTLEPQGEPALNAMRGLGRLEVGQGRFDEATRHLRSAAADLRIDSLPDLAAARAELAIWLGHPQEARVIVAEALTRLAPTSESVRLGPLVALGLRAEADLAELARVRRTAAAVDEATEFGGALLSLIMKKSEVLADATGDRLRELIRADVRTAHAEHDRLSGPGDPVRWASVADAWSALAMPYPAAYARFRAASGQLASRSGRVEAASALQDAWRAAQKLGAEPLVREIEAIAQRAHVPMAREAASTAGQRAILEPQEVGGSRPAPVGQGAAPAARQLGLTRREVEILRLVATGRTNRQIAEALFITEKTAGVHMTNILGKLGVPSRYDAAAMAQRLGLTTGEPSRAGERVARTFMFTDIVGSIQLMEVIGDSPWADLLTWHDAALRGTFGAHDGEEVDHAGDGFFVAFAYPASAVACAIEVQRTLTRHRHEQGFAPSVRIGIHRGEATRTAQGFTGKDVHTGSLIAAEAQGGEILASRTSVTGLSDVALAGAPRTLELKGLWEPVSVVSIEWRGRERD
jgi:class 3 adenylate cyclase/tetratricopeptide (TPR) repeat protein